MKFDGETIIAERDADRLQKQLDAVRALMRDGAWRTLSDIRAALDLPPEAAVDSRLRDLRKSKFGGYMVESRFLRRGIFQYRVLSPVATGQGVLFA